MSGCWGVGVEKNVLCRDWKGQSLNVTVEFGKFGTQLYLVTWWL